jgi:hypothetical protein
MKRTIEEEKQRIRQMINELDFGPKGMWRDEEGTAQWPGKPPEMEVIVDKLGNAVITKDWALVEEVLQDLRNTMKDPFETSTATEV